MHIGLVMSHLTAIQIHKRKAKQKEKSINNHPSALDEMFLTPAMKSVAIL